jgi:hypothetical protein
MQGLTEVKFAIHASLVFDNVKSRCNFSVGHGVEVGECPEWTSAAAQKARTTPPKMPLNER